MYSYGFHLVHNFIFTNGRGSLTTTNEAIEQLLTRLNLPAKLADELAEQ